MNLSRNLESPSVVRSACAAEKSWSCRTWLAPLSAFGFCLRVYDLGRQSLWRDETYGVLSTRMPLKLALIYDSIHPPLYRVLAHFVSPFTSRPEDLRILAVIVGALAIPVMFFLMREMAGDREACLAAVILALSPLHIWLSREVRHYSLVLLLLLLQMLCAMRVINRQQRCWVVAYSVASLLLFYTHYLGAEAILAGLITYLVCWHKLSLSIRQAIIASHVVIAVSMILTVQVGLRIVTRCSGLLGWQYAGLDRLLGSPLGAVYGWMFNAAHILPPPPWDLLILPASLALILCAASGAAALNRRGYEQRALFWPYAVFPFVFAEVLANGAAFPEPKYWVLCYPAWCMALAAGLIHLWCQHRLLGVAIAAAVLPCTIAGVWRVVEPGPYANPDWRSVASFLSRELRAQDAIVVPPWDRELLDVYAPSQAPVLEAVKNVLIDRNGHGVPLSHFQESHRRLWVVFRPSDDSPNSSIRLCLSRLHLRQSGRWEFWRLKVGLFDTAPSGDGR